MHLTRFKMIRVIYIYIDGYLSPNTYLSLQISMSVNRAVMIVMGMQPVITLLVASSAPAM